MISHQPCQERFWRLGRRLLTFALLTAGLAAPSSGCSLMPQPMHNLPAKIGIKSPEAELRAKVEADKFPTAKEAGI